MKSNIPEYVNVPIWDLPAYTGCYKECKVYFFHFSNGTSTHTTITPEEALFIRNLYERHREKGIEVPADSELEDKIQRLINKGLIKRDMKRVALTKTAYDSDYTFVVRS